MMKPITYSLNTEDSHDFYETLSVFTDKILVESNLYLKEEIQAFMSFAKEEQLDSIRSKNEYIVEFIAAGLFFEIYSGYAASSAKFTTHTMDALYRLRKKSTRLRPYVDTLRGYLSSQLLYVQPGQHIEPSSAMFDKLLKWLKATGEFQEEAERLEKWSFFFFSLTHHKSSEILAKAIAFAGYFKEQAKLYLGQYTSGVNDFLQGDHQLYKNREDNIFCGRKESEYHFNMFGAEVLNRELRAGFYNTSKKVLLVPTCMSKPAHGICKAKANGYYFSCTSCSENCNINSIKKNMKNQDVEILLISHSSGFSEILKNWANQHETGLIGVACVLNLLKGGYEMQKLSIPSQCVFLDNCGCKKHWHQNGVATQINLRQLQKIMDQAKIIPVHNNTEEPLVTKDISVA
jgi:uncharacterized protein